MANTNDVCVRLNTYANSHVWSKSASVRKACWGAKLVPGRSVNVAQPAYKWKSLCRHTPACQLCRTHGPLSSTYARIRSRRTVFRACTPHPLVTERGALNPDGTMPYSPQTWTINRITFMLHRFLEKIGEGAQAPIG
jgi:hypothetical protein